MKLDSTGQTKQFLHRAIYVFFHVDLFSQYSDVGIIDLSCVTKSLGMRSHVLKLSAVMTFHAFRGRSLRAKNNCVYVQVSATPFGRVCTRKVYRPESEKGTRYSMLRCRIQLVERNSWSRQSASHSPMYPSYMILHSVNLAAWWLQGNCFRSFIFCILHKFTMLRAFLTMQNGGSESTWESAHWFNEHLPIRCG